MRLTTLEVPKDFNRNAPEIAALGPDDTGFTLLGMLAEAVGRPDLEGIRVLDIGCGVRFTSAIVNRQVSIGKYIGIENDRRVFDFLVEHVAPFDDRFEFKFWNARNAKYSPDGVPLSSAPFPPIVGPIDIVSMFSVITHQRPDDARVIFQHARKAVGDGGRMFFTALIDANIAGFHDGDTSQPLLLAYYSPALLQSLLRDTGWRIERIDPVTSITQTRYTCSIER